jgi:hypothetical protein
MIQAMNRQINPNPAPDGRLIKRAGRALASVVCVAFMLDCLADEAWPGPAETN